MLEPTRATMCPTCKSPPGSRCKTSTGNLAPLHESRREAWEKAGRPSAARRKPNGTVVTIRLPQGAYDSLEAAAATAGVTEGVWVRNLVIGALNG